jgi:hypothetical protein
MTPEEAEAYQRDADFASKLLSGIWHTDRDGIVTEIEFLSNNTKPTEDEARAALARVLRAKDTILSRSCIERLADLLDPKTDHPRPRKLVFKTIDTDFATGVRNAQIAFWILNQQIGNAIDPEELKDYNEATEAAAERFGMSDRHAKRIYRDTVSKRHRPKRKPRRSGRRTIK